MKGVVLAGGFGTRLRPLTYNIPKPMVPIANIPIMEHNIKLLKKYDVTDIVVILYFQAEIIKEYFGDGSKWGVNIKYHRADFDYGTAGAVRDSIHLIGKDDIIIVSADVLTDFNLKNAMKYALESGLFTIVLTSVSNPLDYGIVIYDKENTITKFLEKPSWGQVFSDQINTGIYVVKNKILKEIPEKQFFDFSKDLFPKLMDKGINIKAYTTKGYWRDIGNITEYRISHLDILKGKLKIQISGKRLDILGQDVRCEENVTIENDVDFSGTVIIGENTFIESGSYIENCVIGRNVKIGKGCVIKNSIVWDNVIVQDKARLHENIIGYDVKIGRKCYVSEGVVVSDKCVIGNDVSINPGIKIWPQKKVENGATVDRSIIWGEKWNKNLFGNYGITGIANAEINPEFAAKLGSVYGTIIGKSKKIVLGRDSHKTSRMITRAFITGLLSVGLNVDYLTDIPLPVLRYQMKRGAYNGAVFVRMSPMDKELMDIKFYDSDGFDLSVDMCKNIERLYYREDFIRTNYKDVGNISYPYRMYEHYKEGFENYLNISGLKKKLSVIIDYSYGLASKNFPLLAGQLVKNHTGLNLSSDENRDALEPQEYDLHIHQLSEMVKSLKLDAGFFIDLSGETIVVFDEKGKKYQQEDLLILVSYILINYTDLKKMIVPVHSPAIIEEFAKKKKVELIYSPANLQFLGRKIVTIDSDIVGTCEGSFMFPLFNNSLDGMMTIGMLLKTMSQNDLRLGEIWKNINNKRKYVKNRIPVKIEKKGVTLRKLYQKFKSNDIMMIDGVSVKFSQDLWMSIIPDPDEGYFNIFGEYAKKEEWQKKLKVVKDLIEMENK